MNKTYILSLEQREKAFEYYKSLALGSKEEEITKGDDFFHLFGPGNFLEIEDRPFERFNDYEFLLLMMLETDKDKYQKIHKGTPFYFLGWIAFDLRNYEKALFYMDAAMSEDIRNIPKKWRDNPAAKFLMLRDGENQVAQRVILEVRTALDTEIARFNSISGLPSFTLDQLVDGLLSILNTDKKARTLITAFYTFVLEFSERYTDLQLRSIEGGSVEPFLTHLFKGALIFE